jgi:hypothetical protein
MSRARSEMETRLTEMRLRLETQAAAQAAAQAPAPETGDLPATQKQFSQTDPAGTARDGGSAPAPLEKSQDDKIS